MRGKPHHAFLLAPKKRNAAKGIAAQFQEVVLRHHTDTLLRRQARGSERYGVVVSSQAQRLRPHAIHVKAPVDPVHWFLHDKEDVRSSYYLEDVATEFATEMIRQIRGRLERAFDDGGDENEVGERIRACYREWKTQRIADTASHFVVVAFSRGVAEAGAAGSASRWLVDDGDAACPDCDDNALAGLVVKGDPFPTGDLCPPAHPGCRCLAVPEAAG